MARTGFSTSSQCDLRRHRGCLVGSCRPSDESWPRPTGRNVGRSGTAA